MKKLMAILLVTVIAATMFAGCKKDDGLFSMTKPKERQSNTEQEPVTATAPQNELAGVQEDLDALYQKYDAVTSALSEQYSVFKLITPKYIERIPDRLGDLVDKYIFPEETEDVPSTSEAAPEN